MNTIFKLTVIIAALLFSDCYAQNPVKVEWEHSTGGNTKSIAKSVALLSNGYVMAGETKSNDAGKEIFVVAVDKTGKELWKNNFGSVGDDSAMCIVSSNNNTRFYIAGVMTEKESSNKFISVLCIDKTGKQLWQKKYSGSDKEEANAILPLSDGGLFVVGATKNKGDNDKDVLLLKLNDKGMKDWHMTYGNRHFDDVAFSITETYDDNYLIVGYSIDNVTKKENIYAVKVDKYGTIKWEKNYGGNDSDVAFSVCKTTDRNYLICGYTKSQGFGEEDMYLIKIDDNGKVIWEKTFGGNQSDAAYCVSNIDENQYIFGGFSKTTGNGKPDAYLIKINNNGEVIWERTIGKKPIDVIYSLLVENKNNIICSGLTTNSENNSENMWMVKINDNSESIIAEYMNSKMSDWQTKKASETDADFQKRINSVSNEDKRHEFRKEAVNLYSNDGVSLTKPELLTAQNNQESSEELYRGGGDPLTGLNVNVKPKVNEPLKIGNYYCLIIGIDNYSGEWYKLKNAVSDAKSIETLLKTKYNFTNFKTLYNETATRQNIIKEFEWLINNAKETDNVFIYYSGHGEYKQELNKGFWVPFDAAGKSTADYISNNDIQMFMGGMKAKHVLLISDACFSGDIFRGNTISIPFENNDKYYKKVHSTPSRKAITSGGIEPVMDGGKEGHSVFAYYLIKSLSSNKDKLYDASQLFENIKISVVNNSEQTPNFQSIKNAGDEGGQFIFILK